VADRQVDVLSAAFAVQRCGARVRSQPLAEECRIFEVQSLCRDPVDCSQHHQSTLERDSRPACEWAARHVPPAVMGGKILAPSHLICPAVLRVQTVQVNGPPALPSLQLLAVHPALVSLARMVKVKYLPAVPDGLPRLHVFLVQRALVFLDQMMKATHLLELLSRREVFAQIYLAGPAKSAALPRLQPDSRQFRVMRCPLAARPRELAAARSWDSRFSSSVPLRLC